MTEKRQSFQPEFFRRRLKIACRMPLLSIGMENSVTSTCWERGKRVRIELKQRWRGHELARTEDMFVFDYLISKFMHMVNQNNGSIVRSLLLDVDLMIVHLKLEPRARAQIIDSLRRLTNTLVSPEGWEGPPLPTRFPLLQISREDGARASVFRIDLSELLENELASGQVVVVTPAAIRLYGIHQRIHGWALGWVGPRYDDGRLIRQYEALDRIGPVLPQFGTPWEQIVPAVLANELPDFHLKLITFENQPAIYVRKRSLASVADTSTIKEITLDF